MTSARLRIVVTGARGFVGGHVCHALADAGHEVRQAVREDWGDLAARRDFTPLFEGADAVVHLANIAHRDADEAELRRVNVQGTAGLAQAAERAGVRRFVYLSSVKVHGERSHQRPLDESSPLVPEDAYGRAKLEAERALASVDGMEHVVLRPPLVYGPGVRGNFLRLLRAIERGWPIPVSSIENRRSLLYVRNLADAVAVATVHPNAAGATFLLTDGAALSSADLVRSLATGLVRRARFLWLPLPLLTFGAALCGRRADLDRFTGSLELDDHHIRAELGWRPPYTLEEGLSATAVWFRRTLARVQ